MMIRTIYVIKDKLSGTTSPLFLAPNADTAEREFGLFLANSNIPPKDYDLYEVGSIDLDVVRITDAPSAPIHICNGASIEQPGGNNV